MARISALDSVEWVPIADIRPYERNPRKHPAKQIERLASAIEKFGWTYPIIVDANGEIIAGHGRYAAAKMLGLERVPVVVASDWGEAKIRAYRVIDNRLADMSNWDLDYLEDELREIGCDGFDVSDIIGDMLAVLDADPVAAQVAQEVDETSMPRATVPGDVWVLGDHRLMCGDATNPEDVDRLLDGEQIDFVFTSPPYLYQREYNGGIGDWDRLMDGTFLTAGERLKPGKAMLVNLGIVYEGGRVARYWDGWLSRMEESGYILAGWYVWDKVSAMPTKAKGHLAVAHEFIFHLSKGKPELVRKWVDKKNKCEVKVKRMDREKDNSSKMSTSPLAMVNNKKVAESVFRVKAAVGARTPCDHPAIFPERLPAEAMMSFSDEGDIIYEPFCGSGTTILAAHNLRRRCRAMEISPEYVDCVIVRWQDKFGTDAIHAETGKTFNDVAKERKLSGGEQE